MKISEIMTTGVCSVKTNATLLDALKLMIGHRISGLPVVDASGQLVGMVTEGDLMRRSETGTEKHRPRWLEFFTSAGKLADEYVKAHGRQIEELMTASPVTIGPEQSLEDGVSAMAKHNIRRLPVVENGRLVGIVSRSDLIARLFREVLGENHAPLEDGEIAAAILKEVQGQDWAPQGTLGVSVTNGIVEFSGVTTTAGAPQALKVIAENIPGVKRVIDRLIWVDPYSGLAIPSSDNSTTPASAN